MAGISRTFKLAELRKRLAGNSGGGLVACTAWSAPVLTLIRRNTNESVYDRNVEEEQFNVTAIPDEVKKPESDKYWAPNPNTGVFGPESGNQQQGAAGAKGSSYNTADQHSVLEEKAWFRPTSLEDLEKSP